jgi:hypothetical protein
LYSWWFSCCFFLCKKRSFIIIITLYCIMLCSVNYDFIFGWKFFLLEFILYCILQIFLISIYYLEVFAVCKLA